MTIIIGAGISGLSVAYHLQKLGKPYLLLESTTRVGGYLQSIREGNYLFELAANSILADNEILDFIIKIGLENELLYPNATSNKRYILKNGRYCALPSSPPSLIFNTFFSWKTKLKILQEFRNKTVSPENETVAGFFERRFGLEILEYAVNPFVMGIYAGNPKKLLIAKTFPLLVNYEKNYGSVLKGLIKNKSGSRKLSLNFKEGIETLPKRMAEGLNIKFDTKIYNIIPKNTETNQTNKICVSSSQGNFECDNLVITTPTFHTQVFVNQHFNNFSEALKKINYPPLVVVHSVFKKTSVGLKLDGFGGLHPKIENRFSAGAIWTSSILSNRCPDDEIMLTSFIGGDLSAENTKLPNEMILEKLNLELKELYKITDLPILQRITKWENAIPQYDSNMILTDKIIADLAKQNLFICANWHLGVSLADAMKKGKKMAEEL